MKLTMRFGCIVLSLVLLFACVFSVSADTEDFYSLNLLDYSTLDNSGSNIILFSGGQASFFYDIPFDTRIYQSEAFVKVSGSSNKISTISAVDDKDRTYEIEFLHLTNGYYRLLFDLRGNTVGRLTFNVIFEKTSQTSFQFHEFLCSPIDSIVYNPLIDCYLQWVTSSNTTNDDSWLGVNNFLSNGFISKSYRLDLVFGEEWQKYDFLDICLTLDSVSLDSVNVMIYSGANDDVSVPFEIKEITSSSSVPSHTTTSFMLHVDLTTVPRSGELSVLFRGYGTVGEAISQYVTLNSCTAYVRSKSSNPIFYWLNNIRQSLKDSDTLFSIWMNKIFLVLDPPNSDASADDFKDKVDDQKTELDDIKDHLDSVEKPNASDVNLDFNNIISNSDINVATAPLTSLLSNEIFGNVLILVVTFATISFILYGKR